LLAEARLFAAIVLVELDLLERYDPVLGGRKQWRRSSLMGPGLLG
jgi:hypothetical protein